ncbi:hypothetical protein ACIQVR_40790 [Streptomyces xanthochromogenes]|uniref:hypothetical protein n=1 Tax=Streptomyces xanthochromogenes TaxID=67384 RepID=UPI003815581B
MAIPGNFLSATTESIDPNTSGWVAKTNCSIALGTGGRNGDGTLKLTSLAAGEMQARTVSSYPVIANMDYEYEAFADASGATMPERIGIRWLTSTNTEISISWSVTTSSASATWHRIGVAAVPPTNATQAQVVVSVMTPAAAGVIGYFENIYLGLPIRTTGNMLAFSTETMERGLGDWLNESNCSLSLQTPMVSWAVDNYLAGGQVLAMTVTANGNAWCRTTDWPPATAGQEYLAYAYINPPSSGSTCWIEIRFQNAAGAQLSATRSNLAAPGTGWYREFVSAVAPATTASVDVAIGITSGTAAQVVRTDGVVITPVPVLHTGNVIPYADFSFEQGVAGWTTVSGVGVVSRSTPWGTFFFGGAYAGTVTSATATASVIRSAKFPLASGAAGSTFRLETLSNASAGGWTWTRGVRWYGATNTDLGLTASSSGAVPTPNWWQNVDSFTAPANATQAAVEYTLTATAVNSVLRLDQISLWPSLAEIEADGDDDTASATLTMRELSIGYYITVWRQLPDASRTLVRGSAGLIQGQLITGAELVIEDYEAPLGTAFFYYVETRDSTGALVEQRTSNSVTLDAGNPQYAWLKDPANPQKNLKVMVAKAPDWQRAATQSEIHVRGRRNPVILSDVRGGLVGDLSVFTLSDAERAALHWLLDAGTVLLWQATPGYGVSDMYVMVGQVAETRGAGAATDPIRTWTLPLTQVDMPVTLGVAGSAGRTWQDILSEFATWSDVLASFATWEDVRLNKRIGG